MQASDTPHARPAPADGLHLEARILSVLTHLAATQVVLAATGIVRNKVVALRLGPAAFGEFAQIATVMGVVTTLVGLGMGVSLKRNAARARSDAERAEQLATANGMVLGLSAIAIATTVAMLWSGRLLDLAALTPSPPVVVATLLFVAAIPVEGLRNNYLALLQGVLDVRGLAVRRSLAVLIATTIAIPAVWFLGFVGAAVQFVLLSVLVAVLLGARCRALGLPPLRVRLDRRIVPQLASFGLASLASGFAQSFADAAVRTRLIEISGAASNGVLQATFVLSTTMKGIVLASIGTISLATIGAKTDRAEISATMDRILKVVLPVGAVSLGLLGLLGALALTLLYSPAFVPGVALLPYILSADVILSFVWVIGAPLLANGDRVLWLTLDLVYAGARWATAILLLPRFGPIAVVAGYLAAAALHLALNYVVFRRRYGLRVAPHRVRQLAEGVALVAALSLVGALRPESVPLLGVGLAVWGAYALWQVRQTHVIGHLRRWWSS